VIVTVQFAVIGPVVYVVPLSEPPQPEAVATLYPARGWTCSCVDSPLVTVALVGVTVAPESDTAVTT